MSVCVCPMVLQFDRQGQCTRIPQIGDPKAQATACSSSRSCVAAYSTEVGSMEGLLGGPKHGEALKEVPCSNVQPAVSMELMLHWVIPHACQVSPGSH
jgi:hypothetical protein